MGRSIFTSETLGFLRELAANNDRDWFAEHKPRYEAAVLEPALRFIGAMQTPLAGIAPSFQAVPKRVGGSLMRVYRDTRFSRNKAPYKTNIGIQFRHSAGKDVHAPGFYLHIEPDSVFVGAGSWHPAAPMLAAIRSHLAANSTAWRRAIGGKRFNEYFALEGERLKRPPRGFDADHPCIEDLKRKDFIAVANFAPTDVLEDDFIKQVVSRFRAAKPFMQFLCDANSLSL
ncbi:MAG: DUF2461 domain-containing protein [Pseudomonadota bacterium]